MAMSDDIPIPKLNDRGEVQNNWAADGPGTVSHLIGDYYYVVTQDAGTQWIMRRSTDLREVIEERNRLFPHLPPLPIPSAPTPTPEPTPDPRGEEEPETVPLSQVPAYPYPSPPRSLSPQQREILRRQRMRDFEDFLIENNINPRSMRSVYGNFASSRDGRRFANVGGQWTDITDPYGVFDREWRQHTRRGQPGYQTRRDRANMEARDQFVHGKGYEFEHGVRPEDYVQQELDEKIDYSRMPNDWLPEGMEAIEDYITPRYDWRSLTIPEDFQGVSRLSGEDNDVARARDWAMYQERENERWQDWTRRNDEQLAARQAAYTPEVQAQLNAEQEQHRQQHNQNEIQAAAERRAQQLQYDTARAEAYQQYRDQMQNNRRGRARARREWEDYYSTPRVSFGERLRQNVHDLIASDERTKNIVNAISRKY